MKSVVNFLRTVAGRQGHKGAPQPASQGPTISDVLRAPSLSKAMPRQFGWRRRNTGPFVKCSTSSDR
jgi:hypothetical protein